MLEILESPVPNFYDASCLIHKPRPRCRLILGLVAKYGRFSHKELTRVRGQSLWPARRLARYVQANATLRNEMSPKLSAPSATGLPPRRR